MFRAVIFDFDGVITDSEILHFNAFNQVLGRYGIEITKQQYYKEYLGLTDAEVFGLMVEQGRLGPDAPAVEDLIKQKNQIFERLAENQGGIIEGVSDFLEMLRRNNIPMAICSGALLAEIKLILDQAQLSSFFEVIVSAEQVKKGKPNQEGFLLALQKLNEANPNPVLAGQCIVIEDSHWGLEAAGTAGMHTVAITNSYDADQLAMAEKVITHLSELSMSDLQKVCAD